MMKMFTLIEGICVFYDLEIYPSMDNDKLIPSILVEYFCKMLGNIPKLQFFSKCCLMSKGNGQVIINDQN